MKNHNPNNERIKRKYLVFVKEAKQQNESSVDAIAQALSRFESYTKYRDFNTFHFEQAINFKKHLSKQINQRTGAMLSKATLNSTLRHVKSFFQWLAMQPGYKSRINYTDIEYFNLSEKEMRIATAQRKKPIPTIEQIKHVINLMPSNTKIEKRNRALIAFILLTGARDGAIISLKLKHIDFINNNIFQDAREVETKFSKSFTSDFFPVGDEIIKIVYEWVTFLKNELLFGNDDPLFPKTEITLGKFKKFEYSGLTKEHWQTTTSIRNIFREAFCAAGLPYFNPHSFRKTLANLGEKICLTPEALKAWSQNLGHEEVLTTLRSYGEVQPQRQAEIFQELRSPKTKISLGTEEMAKAIVREMRNQGVG